MRNCPNSVIFRYKKVS